MSSQPPPKNPFKGLRPFQQDEQEELFGRERDLILMKDRILSSRTTLLFAGSGVGKTSFLNAKIIPALEERYCVVWHNRWIGAEARSDDSNWDDHPRFKIWPPKALARWVAETLWQPAWLRHKLSQKNFLTWEQAKLDAASPATDAAHQKVTEAVQNVISQSLRPGNKRRLSRVLSIFKKKAESAVPQKPCILILDQFEEIFQYHAYETYFQDFISDLCKVINDESYQVRVVFSMREEFLGELSVFDNRIPDLFNNYYRLRYPEKDEARYIITETCKLVAVEPAAENLDKLVDDLSTIEKSFDAGRDADKNAKKVRLVRRNFVPPPYLQIVCDTLWKEQFGDPVHAATVATNGDSAEQKPVRFLENYKAGVENPANGEESGAQKAVREFCEAKLSPPFLKKWEQSVAARAFGFLVTKQGAKMAYELRSLASHMDERVWPLRHTLHKLSRPEARILRETRGPEGSYWFELYHDMYAGVVDRWKRRFRREQRKRQRRKLLVSASFVALLILVPLAVLNWYVYPRRYRQTINQFRNSLETTDVKNAPGYTSAVLAYSKLSETFGYRGEARSLWAEVWQRRAVLFEAAEQREEALLCLLQAAALAKGYPSEKEFIAQANNLLTGNEDSIRETYCYDCQLAELGPDGQYILTMTSEGNVDVWSRILKMASKTVCVGCNQARFSADGKIVAAVRVIEEEPGVFDINTGKRVEPLTASPAESPSDSRPSPKPTPTPATASNLSQSVAGWELTIATSDPTSDASRVSFVIRNPRSQPQQLPQRNSGSNSTPSQVSADSPDQAFRLKAVTRTPDGFTPAGYLVTGFLNGQLTIWRGDGSPFVASVPLERNTAQDPSEPAVSFSADGRFVAASGPGYQAALWEVTTTGLSRVNKIDTSTFVMRPLFSPDSKYLLARTRAGELKLWELSTQTEVLVIPPPEGIGRYGFAKGSSKFFVADEGESITVWDSETKKRLSTIKHEPVASVFLRNDAKALVLTSYSTLGKYVFEKWSLETGTKIGELETDSTDTGIFATSDGDSLVLLANSIARLWTIPSVNEPQWVNKIAGDRSSLAGLSDDGNTMLVMSNEPAAFHLLDISQQKEIRPIAAVNYWINLLSPDGNRTIIRAALNSLDLYDRNNSQSKTTLTFEAAVAAAAFSPDSRVLAVATGDKQIHLIDLSTGARYALNTDVELSSLVFSHDSKYLMASRTDSFVEPKDPFANTYLTLYPLDVWSVSDGKKTEFNFYQIGRVLAVAISNERLAMFQDQNVLLFNVKDGQRVGKFDYGQDLALLTLSPDGKLVLTCDRKGLMQMWDAQTGTLKDQTTLGSPARKIIFYDNDGSFIAITDYWIHRIDIGDRPVLAMNGDIRLIPRLRYAKGIFTGQRGLTDVRLLTSKSAQEPSVPYVRWIREGFRGVEVVDSSFDGKLSKPVLAGDSERLWFTWRGKLGFKLSPEDLIEKDIPDRALSSGRMR